MRAGCGCVCYRLDKSSRRMVYSEELPRSLSGSVTLSRFDRFPSCLVKADVGLRLLNWVLPAITRRSSRRPCQSTVKKFGNSPALSAVASSQPKPVLRGIWLEWLPHPGVGHSGPVGAGDCVLRSSPSSVWELPIDLGYLVRCIESNLQVAKHTVEDAIYPTVYR